MTGNFLKENWKKTSWVAASLAAAFSAVSHTPVDSFAVQETFYKLSSDIIKPRMAPQIPFAQFTHNYKENTQKAEFNAGSWRFWPFANNTQDHNALTARIVLNYKVLPDAEKLSYRLWEMDGFVMPDGYWVLTEMMNDSANVVMGRKDLAETMANPDEFLKDFKKDLQFRFAQNNIPVEIESIEFKHFSTTYWPVRSLHYSILKGP